MEDQKIIENNIIEESESLDNQDETIVTEEENIVEYDDVDDILKKIELLIGERLFDLANKFLTQYLKSHDYNSFIYYLLLLISLRRTYEQILEKPISIQNKEYYGKIMDSGDLKIINKVQKLQIAYLKHREKLKALRPKTPVELALEVQNALRESDITVLYSFDYFKKILNDRRVYCLSPDKMWYETTLDNSKITIKNGTVNYNDITESTIEYVKKQKAYYVTFKSDYADFFVYLLESDKDKGLEMLTAIYDTINFNRGRKIKINFQKELEDKPVKFDSFKQAFKKLSEIYHIKDSKEVKKKKSTK